MLILNIVLITLILVILARDLYTMLKINKRECTVEKPKMSEEDKKQYEKTKKAFNSLMGYGYEDAIKRGNVDGD